MTEKEKLQEIQDELRKVLGLKKTLRDLGPEEVKSYEKTLENLIKNNRELKAFQQLQKQINRDLIEAEAAVSGIRDAFAAAVNELTGMNAGLNRAKKAFRGLESIADKLSNDQADISRLSLKELKTIEEKVNKKIQELKVSEFSLQNEIDSLEAIKDKDDKVKKQLKLKKEALNATKQELQDFKKGIGLSNKLIEQANNRIAAEKEISKVMGAAPAMLEGIGKALQKIGLPDFGIKEAITNAKNIIRLKNEEFDLQKKIAVEAQKEKITQMTRAGASQKSILKEVQQLKKLEKSSAKRVSSTEALGDVLGEIGKKFKEQLTTANLIQGAILQITAAMVKLDKFTGTLAKNLGVSFDESLDIQRNFNQIALNSDRIMVSTSSLNESFSSLNQRFQGATGFSNEMLESFTALTKQAGFSAEAISDIAVITGTQGKELENNVALMQGQLAVMNAQEGTSFSTKQVLEGIGKISKATLLTLRNQPKALVRTLMTSKKLVLSFQEMESIASSLLDFEGSIQAELEAELLTGKQINLEQARLLALKGDIAGAAAEVAKEVGSAAEFERMNVIQQEALAKAAGLTREQLANSLMEREALAKLGGQDKTALEAYNRLKKQGLSDEQIATKLGDKRLADQLKSQSVQERFAASVERLQEIFVDVAQAILPIASIIADMIVGISKFVAKFSFLLKPIILIVGAFKTLKLLIGGIRKLNNLNLLTKLKEYKLQLGLDKLFKRGYIQAKAAYVLNKLGVVTDKQAAFFKGRIAFFENASNKTAKNRLAYENASLLTVLRRNIAEKAGNALKFIGLQFTKEGYIYQGLIFIKEQAINALKVIGNALGFTSLSTTVAEGAAETVITSNKAAQNTSVIGLITKGLTYLGVLVAQAAAAITAQSALSLGIGTVIALAAAAAGIAYLYSITKPKKAGDMMMADGKTQISPAEGGLFELSSNDQFVAAPGVADAVTGRNRSQRREERQQRREQRREQRQNDNTKLEASMNKTNKILEIVANNLKPKPVLGSEVGQAVNVAEYNVQ
tara:strand:- start:5244 stop:8324 length:3081 start_codon:yes stop_codon:yes gene_type:complete